MSLIKKGRQFRLSAYSCPEFSSHEFVALEDIDLKKEFEDSIEPYREDNGYFKGDTVNHADVVSFMARRLMASGKVDALDLDVYHLETHFGDIDEKKLADFYLPKMEVMRDGELYLEERPIPKEKPAENIVPRPPRERLALRVLENRNFQIRNDSVCLETRVGDDRYILRAFNATGEKMQMAGRIFYPSKAGTLVVVLDVVGPGHLLLNEIEIRIESDDTYLVSSRSALRDDLPPQWETIFNGLLDKLFSFYDEPAWPY
jgi:hypothetical protein